MGKRHSDRPGLRCARVLCVEASVSLVDAQTCGPDELRTSPVASISRLPSTNRERGRDRSWPGLSGLSHKHLGTSSGTERQRDAEGPPKRPSVRYGQLDVRMTVFDVIGMPGWIGVLSESAEVPVAVAE